MRFTQAAIALCYSKRLFLDTRVTGSRTATKVATELSESGYNKGTITDIVRYFLISSDVRQHRLISISYISLLPCHGKAKKVFLRSAPLCPLAASVCYVFATILPLSMTH